MNMSKNGYENLAENIAWCDEESQGADMPPHLEQQLCNRIIVWHYEGRKSVQEIAELAGCSERMVYEILKLQTSQQSLCMFSGSTTHSQARGHCL